MDFNENAKPIYLQIADRICDEATAGKYPPDGRIPSVREYAALMQVNFNTLMRTYEYLASKEIIYNKRGVGYFMAPDCIDKINKMREETFFNTDLLYFFERLHKIGISPERLSTLYSDYCNSTPK